MANAYVMRTNMSVAIVAMVNHSAIHGDDELVDDECDGVYGNDSSNSAVSIDIYVSPVSLTFRYFDFSSLIYLDNYLVLFNSIKNSFPF